MSGTGKVKRRNKTVFGPSAVTFQDTLVLVKRLVSSSSAVTGSLEAFVTAAVSTKKKKKKTH